VADAPPLAGALAPELTAPEPAPPEAVPDATLGEDPDEDAPELLVVAVVAVVVVDAGRAAALAVPAVGTVSGGAPALSVLEAPPPQAARQPDTAIAPATATRCRLLATKRQNSR
jgi:hypothetical protein